MSTRGAVGVATGGKLYISYKHGDAYPSWLGRKTAEFCEAVRRLGALKKLADAYRGVTLVREDGPKPTKADLKYYKDTMDLTVGNQNPEDWYCLLRGMQGIDGMRAILRGKAKHLIDSSDFPLDSLFCEWAYVVDLDKGVLEVYKGFQQKPHKKGRFATSPPELHPSGGAYYPCKLVKSVPLATITRHSLDKMKDG